MIDRQMIHLYPIQYVPTSTGRTEKACIPPLWMAKPYVKLFKGAKAQMGLEDPPKPP